jgi:ribosomal protein S18 acetylase RimI-like enzyme
MTSDVLVRPGHVADVAGIQRVADEAWHAAYDDIIGPDAVDSVLDEWYEDDAIEAGLDHDEQDFFKAVRDEQVVGYAHAGPHPPRRSYQLYRLYVAPDEWRNGIARQLLAEIEQALYDRDVHFYEAEVLAENDLAVSFYEATGFEQVDETSEDLGGVTVDEKIFRKRL